MNDRELCALCIGSASSSNAQVVAEMPVTAEKGTIFGFTFSDGYKFADTILGPGALIDVSRYVSGIPERLIELATEQRRFVRSWRINQFHVGIFANATVASTSVCAQHVYQMMERAYTPARAAGYR